MIWSVQLVQSSQLVYLSFHVGCQNSVIQDTSKQLGYIPHLAILNLLVRGHRIAIGSTHVLKQQHLMSALGFMVSSFETLGLITLLFAESGDGLVRNCYSGWRRVVVARKEGRREGGRGWDEVVILARLVTPGSPLANMVGDSDTWSTFSRNFVR